MRKSRFTEKQIIGALKQAEAGVKVADICQQFGITEKTYYRWKSKFGGMNISDANRLKALEDENRRLKQMVAEQALDIQALKAVLSRQW
jgi:putative transposase